MSGRDRDEMLELELHLHHQTDWSWLVSDDGKRDRAVWLPRSVVDRGVRTSRRAPTYKFDVPRWMAEREGLV